MKKIISLVLVLVFALFLVGCGGFFTTTLGISVNGPDKTVYTLGEDFDSTGIEVHAYTSDGKSKVLTDDQFTLSNTDLNKLGSHTIRVKYDNKEAHFTVYVKQSDDLIKMVYITNYPTTVFYDEVPTTSSLVLEGLELSYLYNNFDTDDAPLSDFSVVIVNTQLTDSTYTIYAVNLSHKSLEGISTTFLVYVLTE